MFNKQRQDALNWLKDSYKEYPTAKASRRKDMLDTMIDWTTYESQFAEEVKRIYEIVIDETGSAALYGVVADSMVFDAFTPAIQSFLKTEPLKASVSINEETKKQIRAALSQGMMEGESLYELTQRIDQVFGYASSDRAFKIAESETTRSQGYADVEAWEQSGVVDAKEWYTSLDERVCSFCGDMHGRTIPLRDKFYSKGDQMRVPREDKPDAVMNFNYESIYHQPLHVRCRCVMLPIVKPI